MKYSTPLATLVNESGEFVRKIFINSKYLGILRDVKKLFLVLSLSLMKVIMAGNLICKIIEYVKNRNCSKILEII